LISSFRKKPFYRPLIWLGVIICLGLIFWYGARIVTTPKWLQIDDFVEYWAAGYLNINGGNPYDPDQLLPLQIEAGRYFGVPVMMWNPPWMLLLAMPVSLFAYPISRVLWIVFFIIIVLLSINMIWKLYGGAPDLRWVGWLLGFTFVPVLQAFRTGQTSPLLLLGVAGFLYFMDKKKLWLAGVCLSLLMVKPHILYLLLFSVLLWSLYEKQARVLLGLVLALVAATLISWSINTNVISQYFNAVLNYPPQDWATPTIGGITRFVIGTEQFWLQFIPPLLGIGWILFYWYHRRKSWDWIEQTPLILLVSVFTAAYGWIFDQSASLIAIMQIFILLLPIQNKNYSQIAVLSSYILIEIFLLIPVGNQIWQFWLAPALLIWYLISKRWLSIQRPQTANQNSNS